jgi:aspartate racemase
VPLIDIIDETARALRADSRRKPLLLATRYTMEHGFYTQRMARHGIEVVTPDCDDRGVVHDVIFNELCQGQIRDTSRARYLAIIEAARNQGIDSVILGCTEISLLVDPAALPLPGYDSTAIHADAAVRFALTDEMERAA